MDFKDYEQEREKIFEKWWGDFAKSEKRFIDSMPLILHSDRLATIRFILEDLPKEKSHMPETIETYRYQQGYATALAELKTKLEGLLTWK